MTDIRPVVAGVDGSPSSIEAAEYAAALAERRSAPLHLVHAYQRPLYGYDVIGLPLPADSFDDERQREGTLATIRQLADRLRVEHPMLLDLEVEQVLDSPSVQLTKRSRDALVTVVGCRGIGGFAQLVLGSVSSQLAMHAQGPVIVVRPPVAVAPGPEEPRLRRSLGPVLACYDGSTSAEAALRFAACEAAARDVQLIVTHVYTGDDAEAEQLLVNAVKPWADDYEGRPIELRPYYSENTAYALVEMSRNAALTVLGSRGRGGFAGLLLGSVSRTLVHHAYGPVAVIHQTETERE